MGVSISDQRDLETTLLDVRADASGLGEEGIDVRLQILEGECYLWEGDSQYDTDHRGAWGASSIAEDMDDETVRQVAADLWEQAHDAEAEMAS